MEYRDQLKYIKSHQTTGGERPERNRGKKASKAKLPESSPCFCTGSIGSCIIWQHGDTWHSSDEIYGRVTCAACVASVGCEEKAEKSLKE